MRAKHSFGLGIHVQGAQLLEYGSAGVLGYWGGGMGLTLSIFFHSSITPFTPHRSRQTRGGKSQAQSRERNSLSFTKYRLPPTQ